MRVLRPVALVLLAVLVWAPAPAVSDDSASEAARVWNGRDELRAVEAAIEEYFEADSNRQEEIRTFLDDLGFLKEADTKKWAKHVAKVMRKAGPTIERKSRREFTHGELTGVVHTAGRPKKGGALFLALHGGGEGAGNGATALQKWSMIQSKAFVLAPTAPELRNSAWNQPDIEQWLLALIDAAIRSFDLDTNQVYVAGHSMGGYGTWSLGTRYADRFAALGACAGGLFVMRGSGGDVQVAPGHVPNLLNTPIWFFNSTDDPRVRPDSSQAANKLLEELKEAGYPYEWVYDEYDDIGHGLPPKGLKPITDWMLAKKRDPYPKHVIFEPSRPTKRRLFWLACDTDARIEARIDDNTVVVKTRGAPADATIYLNKELIDPAKPVVVRWNDETPFEGGVAPRLSVILETLATGRDPKMAFDRAIRVR